MQTLTIKIQWRKNYWTNSKTCNTVSYGKRKESVEQKWKTCIQWAVYDGFAPKLQNQPQSWDSSIRSLVYYKRISYTAPAGKPKRVSTPKLIKLIGQHTSAKHFRPSWKIREKMSLFQYWSFLPKRLLLKGQDSSHKARPNVTSPSHSKWKDFTRSHVLFFYDCLLSSPQTLIPCNFLLFYSISFPDASN